MVNVEFILIKNTFYPAFFYPINQCSHVMDVLALNFMLTNDDAFVNEEWNLVFFISFHRNGSCKLPIT